jgi:hypothetical protein
VINNNKHRLFSRSENHHAKSQIIRASVATEAPITQTSSREVQLIQKTSSIFYRIARVHQAPPSNRTSSLNARREVKTKMAKVYLIVKIRAKAGNLSAHLMRTEIAQSLAMKNTKRTALTKMMSSTLRKLCHHRNVKSKLVISLSTRLVRRSNSLSELLSHAVAVKI